MNAIQWLAAVVMAGACVLTILTAAQAQQADGAKATAAAKPTIYTLQNRWITDKYLRVDGEQAIVGAGGGKAAQWMLVPAGNAYLLRNVATQCYLTIKDDNGTLIVVADIPKDKRGQWLIEPLNDRVAIRNAATDRYLNLENRQTPDANMVQRPDDDNWWSAQWFVHYISGPKPTAFRAPPPPARSGQLLVTRPQYSSTIRGDTPLAFHAPGMKTATVTSYLPTGAFGEKTTIGSIDLDDNGDGSIAFPADRFPHGPITITVQGAGGDRISNYHLMVFNAGGVEWQQGAPVDAPPPAKEMKLVFADDFDQPQLSISRDGRGATYTSHKPGGGDFSSIPFADHENADTTPFSQMGTWLRIRADKEKNTTGLLSSINMAGEGVTAHAPCYFECRFIAQSAPGTWPAFWVMNTAVHEGLKTPADELDVIEAYGGEGKGHPNQRGYWIATHYWNQGPDGRPDKTQPGYYGQIKMTDLDDADGTRPSWFEMPHTYGVLVGLDDTVYYCDNIEVARHKTAKLSKSQPLFFFINFATGGGWPVDLSQYDGTADMYVDYVRVYQGK